jgi:hypothetical protein
VAKEYRYISTPADWAIAEAFLSYIREGGADASTDAILKLATELDASGDAEAVAFVTASGLARLQEGIGGVTVVPAPFRATEHTQPLYTHPPVESAPEGFVLVPREPTEAMLEAGYGELLSCAVFNVSESDAGHAYRAMLAAAPTKEKDDGL